MSDNGSSNIGWFIAGLGLGALIGVLYAPKSGRETREQLLESANQGRDFVVTRGKQYADQANQWVDEGKKQVTQYVEKGKETVARQKDQISSAIEAGRTAYREATTAGEKS